MSIGDTGTLSAAAEASCDRKPGLNSPWSALWQMELLREDERVDGDGDDVEM